MRQHGRVIAARFIIDKQRNIHRAAGGIDSLTLAKGDKRLPVGNIDVGRKSFQHPASWKMRSDQFRNIRKKT